MSSICPPGGTRKTGDLWKWIYLLKTYMQTNCQPFMSGCLSTNSILTFHSRNLDLIPRWTHIFVCQSWLFWPPRLVSFQVRRWGAEGTATIFPCTIWFISSIILGMVQDGKIHVKSNYRTSKMTIAEVIQSLKRIGKHRLCGKVDELRRRVRLISLHVIKEETSITRDKWRHYAWQSGPVSAKYT